MTHTLLTKIPEGYRVEGLRYGAHTSGVGWSGYYVSVDDGQTWAVARLTPASDELVEPDDEYEDQDAAIVRAITEEQELSEED